MHYCERVQWRGFAHFERRFLHSEITHAHWYHAYLEIRGTLQYGDNIEAGKSEKSAVQTTKLARSLAIMCVCVCVCVSHTDVSSRVVESTGREGTQLLPSVTQLVHETPTARVVCV